ncbi:MAG: Chitinase [Frankiales bacterium]|nr:Chitinase [Frankiales bacterium]
MTPEEQAHAAAIGEFGESAPPRRRLSWVRIAGALIVVAALAGATVGFRNGTRSVAAAPVRSSFAPYVDVTATPTFGFEDPTVTTATSLILGFIVSAPKTACQPSWGGYYSLPSAASGMDLDRRIARVRQRGGQVSVSFGGAANSELSIGCADPTALAAAYRSVITRYAINTIDLDIEGEPASTPAVDARRAEAIASVQAAQSAAGHPLSVWLTLPVAPTGLTSTGQAVLESMLAAHVTLAGVNAMTMDYGNALTPGQSMISATESALVGLQQQLIAAYAKSGVKLSDDAAWQLVGATPMIGQNDTANERFELSDASALVAFAQSHHLRQLSMWSANRDQACGPNYANVEVVSDSCSGVNETANAYTAIFTTFLSQSGSKSSSTGASASPSASGPRGSAGPGPDAADATAPDNPATSPYPIWNPAASYPENTKIVWHHNVYEAKWWTSGDTPDAPVATASDTPWTLLGPVLPGEHPAATPTVQAGTFPAWSAAKIYVAGDRVLYQGGGYQAKWWTQGDVPGVDVLNPSDTPWERITSPN